MSSNVDVHAATPPSDMLDQIIVEGELLSIVISDFAAEDCDSARLNTVCAGNGFQFTRGGKVLGIRETVGDDGGFEGEKTERRVGAIISTDGTNRNGIDFPIGVCYHLFRTYVRL